MKTLPSIKYLEVKKIAHEVKNFSPETEKGAANVAKTLGYTERQMVKTLIFRDNKSGEKVLVMVGADQTAVSGNLKKAIGSRDISMARDEEIIDITGGYKIGSIPPFSWQPKDFRTFIEVSLLEEELLGVGAGTWGSEIMITPLDLVKASGAKVVNLVDKDSDVEVSMHLGLTEIDVDSMKLEKIHQINEVELIPEDKKILLSQLKDYIDKKVEIECWMYNKRSSGKIMFLEIRDGSTLSQAVVEKEKVSKKVWEDADSLMIESSIKISGVVGKHKTKDEYEIHLEELAIIQRAPEYPIGKKEHGPDFLFEKRDLYLRSKTPWAILRVRNQIFLSITNFLNEENFLRFDTPILQPTSCEDTTQLFAVKYYKKMMYLTQSGQLYSEAGIMSFGKVYDFGPVFRAEKSKTRNHLSEFWMMDAEMAFYDQKMNMQLQERLIKRIIKDVLDNCKTELEILNRETKLLEKIVKNSFMHISHHEAKRFLQQNGFEVKYDEDMTTEEEIFLGDHFKNCIFIEDYPFKVKSFYMKKYTDENGIEHAVNSDLIAPEKGREIIGGSQREDDYNTALEEIKKRNYPTEDYKWYLDIRKYGSVPHSGFGIGLERVVRWITGTHHIRETIPFPRTIILDNP